MGDFFRGMGSVVLSGFVGSCLGAAAFLSVEALMPKQAFAESGNWLSFSTHMDVDLDSAKLQPNGVTTYRLRTRQLNPFNGKYFFVYLSRALDCESMETVTLDTGEREPFEPWEGKFDEHTQFSQVAHRIFCEK